MTEQYKVVVVRRMIYDERVAILLDADSSKEAEKIALKHVKAKESALDWALFPISTRPRLKVESTELVSNPNEDCSEECETQSDASAESEESENAS